MLGMNVEKLNNQHLDKSNVIEIHLVPTPTREKARYWTPVTGVVIEILSRASCVKEIKRVLG